MPPALNQDTLKQDSLKHDVQTHFAFGKNWARYGETITQQDIEIAEANLKRFLGLDDLSGKSFLDIGCGSGIHALAALRMGARSVHGIDIDEESVATAKAVLAAHWPQPNHTIEWGNVFEVSPAALGRFDVVYSWGVLHHTGDMWAAIRNAAGFVAPGGLFVIAIYRKTRFCGFWRWEKALYVRSGKPFRALAVSLYVVLRVFRDLLRLRNPIKKIAGHNRKRGMKWYTDVIDWIGGYPYESATPEEIGAFVESLGFRLDQSWKTKAKSGLLGTGNAEYRFRKT
jgi:2-polyprenyl-6-hydroxyphenyl methylase/3-demethylubiquinone-9 3-methyltransferase